jgi:hypothetical protein
LKKFQLALLWHKLFMTSGNNKSSQALPLSLQEMLNGFVVGSSKKHAIKFLLHWRFYRRNAHGMRYAISA